MSTLEIIAVIISIVGVVLTIRRNLWCWFFNIIAYVLYAVLFYEYQLYGETILQIIFVVLSLYGFWIWSKSKKNDLALSINDLTLKKGIKQLLFAMILGLCFGWFLKTFTDASLAMLDAQLAAMSLLATYWTSQRYIETWLLWIVVDILYVGMFVFKSLFLTASLYGIFVALAVGGLIQWKKMQVAPLK